LHYYGSKDCFEVDHNGFFDLVELESIQSTGRIIMRILVVMDPIQQVDAPKDTTVGFILAAQCLGHDVYYCEQQHLFSQDGLGYAHAGRLRIDTEDPLAYELATAQPTALSDFDTVWMRKDPPVDRAYLHATHILDLAGDRTLVVNSPGGLRYANEKMSAQFFPEFCPTTLVTRNCDQIRSLLNNAEEPLVLKPIDGHGGSGVFVVNPGDRNAGSIVETLTEEGRRWVVVQSYLAAARLGDKRIILIDGEPHGAIIRIPKDDDHRGNIHVGGRVEHVDLDERDREICNAIGPRLREDGLWFVGLDIIGGYLTEVNVTSPTGIREIQEFTGRDVGAAYVKWVEEKVKSR